MLKSLHIGRYVTKSEDLRALAAFLEAIGFQQVAQGDGRSAIFSAPVGLLSVNALPSEYPQQVLDHLKDVNRLIVLEVSNPDDVFEIARKKKLKVLADSVSPKTGERSFSLALPGDIIVTVHGKPEELPAGMEGNLKAEGKRFAIVVSRFNAFITERLLQRDPANQLTLQGIQPRQASLHVVNEDHRVLEGISLPVARLSTEGEISQQRWHLSDLHRTIHIAPQHPLRVLAIEG